MTVSFILSQVQKVIRRAGSRDPFDICGCLGIRVRFWDLHGKLKGYFFVQSRIRSIVIDEGLSPSQQRVIAAHELGHAVLHKKLAAGKLFADTSLPILTDTDVPERDANLFAAELLLPDEDVLEALRSCPFFEAARLLEVPPALFDHKILILQKKGHDLPWLPVSRADFLKKNFDGSA